MKFSIECPECGAEKMRTMGDGGGAVLCPNGHGKCVYMPGGQFKSLRREYRRDKWLVQFPIATKQPRGFEIDQRGGRWKRVKPEGAATSVVKTMTRPEADAVVARVNVEGKWRVYYFALLKSRAKAKA
jgi:hypothetical protein